MTIKKQVTEYIQNRDYAGIMELGREKNTQVLRYIQMNIWGDYRQLQRWYALEALEKMAASYGADNDEAYRNVLRRALWAMNDESGNVPWAAPEMMAAVIKGRTEQFHEFIKYMLTNGLDNPMCHIGVLWSVGYLGKENLEYIEPFLKRLTVLLKAKDSEIRGYAAWGLAQLQLPELEEELQALADDEGIVHLYLDGEIRQTTVGEVVRERG